MCDFELNWIPESLSSSSRFMLTINIESDLDLSTIANVPRVSETLKLFYYVSNDVVE